MAETQQAVINDEDFSIERTIQIRASREKVWAAITTPEQMTQWFGQRADIPDFSVGAKGTLGWDGNGEFPILLVTVDKPSVFAYRWVNSPGETVREDNSTLVTFTLEEAGDATMLTVRESGFGIMHPDEAGRSQHLRENQDGWNEELDELIAFLETGAE